MSRNIHIILCTALNFHELYVSGVFAMYNHIYMYICIYMHICIFMHVGLGHLKVWGGHPDILIHCLSRLWVFHIVHTF